MIRCAIIGCGRIAQDIHIHAFRGIPGLSIAAICDGDPHRLHEFGDAWGIEKRYLSADDLLADHPNLDLVSISTPGFTHHALCLQAIDAGVNVFVEKPLALSLADAVEIGERARGAGVKVAVGHSYRFRDAVLAARVAQKNQVLGEIYQCNAVHHSGSIFTEPTPWSWEEQRYKVLLYEMSLHFIDLQVLFAGPGRRIIGFEKRQDRSAGITTKIVALVEHESGAVGLVDLQLFAASQFTRVEVYGRRNDATMSFYPEYCRIGRGLVGPRQDLESAFGRLWTVVAGTFAQTTRPNRVKRRAIPHFRLLRQFVRHIEDPYVPNPVSVESVLPTMRLLEDLGAMTYG